MLWLALSLVSLPIADSGDSETYRCWAHSDTTTPDLSLEVVRCRIGDTSLVEYRSVADVPVELFPALGEDFVGRCWYHQDKPTTLEATSVTDGRAAVLIDYAGGGTPVEVGVVRRCRSEVAAGTSAEVVWEFLRNVGFAHPEPQLAPARGVAGLPSHLRLVLPPLDTVHAYDSERRLNIAIDVELTAVLVDWGDGAGPGRLAPDDAQALTGYPTGRVLHRYESAAVHRIDVIFEWRVSWSTDVDSRREVAVPPTRGGLWYEVDQIVARIVG
jgi:hypothetical protein